MYLIATDVWQPPEVKVWLEGIDKTSPIRTQAEIKNLFEIFTNKWEIINNNLNEPIIIKTDRIYPLLFSTFRSWCVPAMCPVPICWENI